MASGSRIGQHSWSGVSLLGDMQAPVIVQLGHTNPSVVPGKCNFGSFTVSQHVKVPVLEAWKFCLPAVSNSSSLAYGTDGDGQWGAHILEKLTEFPIGPESWEGDRIKTVGAERGFSYYTWLVGVHNGTILRKACGFIYQNYRYISPVTWQSHIWELTLQINLQTSY